MMFKKYGKSFLEKEVIDSKSECSLPKVELFERPDIEEPMTILSQNVSIKGELFFEKTLRIDGSFEGQLFSEGKLIVGPTGSIKADIDLQEAFIAGKVEGNITVKERLVLRGSAEICGNITAPLLSVDEGVSITGSVSVTSKTSIPEETTSRF